MKMAATGSGMGSFDPNDSNIRDLAFDGTHLWAVNSSGEIKKFTTAGVLEDTVSILSEGWGLTYANGDLWASDPNTDMIYRVSMSTGIEEDKITGYWSRFLKLEAHPNPFSGKTVISCQLPKASKWKTENGNSLISLVIYDRSGRLIKRLLSATISNFQSPISIIWDGRNNADEKLPSGVYLYRFSVGDYTTTKKLVLLN